MNNMTRYYLITSLKRHIHVKEAEVGVPFKRNIAFLFCNVTKTEEKTLKNIPSATVFHLYSFIL